MIRFEDVTFQYGENRPVVLDRVSLSIGPGERLAVMGANGSGKSTFARLLAGLLEPTHGRVVISDNRNGGLSVGILFQNPDNQMVAVTVEKEIAFVLENAGVPADEIDRRVVQTLERFSIVHLRQRLTAELSGGEKQRVALAAVMIAEPNVLVMDEPDSFLDQAGKQALWAELETLRRNRPEMIQIHITQYPSTAQSYPRLVVFHKGRIAADKPPEKVFAETGLCRRAALMPDVNPHGATPFPMRTRSVAKPGDLIDRIVLTEATFSYANGEPVLGPVTLTVRAGETLGVVGPSGSGKSTLGLLLCGLLPATSGRIIFADTNGSPAGAEPPSGQVSAVLQQPERQFFLPTCAEEVAFGPGNVGTRLTGEQTSAMLAGVGLEPEEFAQRDPFRLSGGEKRRLAFAAVLSMGPRIIVFDEPTCALDQEGVARFIQLVRELKEAGAGVVVISHDGDVIRALADNILHLNGRGKCQLLTAKDFFQSQAYREIVSPLTWSKPTS